MYPVPFEGATEFKKPESMTDEQCSSAWAQFGFTVLKKIFANHGKAPLPPHVYEGIDTHQFHFFVTAWQPTQADRAAILRGEPIYIKTVAQGLPPMSVFTLDENGESNND